MFHYDAKTHTFLNQYNINSNLIYKHTFITYIIAIVLLVNLLFLFVIYRVNIELRKHYWNRIYRAKKFSESRKIVQCTKKIIFSTCESTLTQKYYKCKPPQYTRARKFIQCQEVKPPAVPFTLQTSQCIKLLNIY